MSLFYPDAALHILYISTYLHLAGEQDREECAVEEDGVAEGAEVRGGVAVLVDHADGHQPELDSGTGGAGERQPISYS